MLTDAGMRFLGESAYTVDRNRVSEIHDVVSRGRGLGFLLGAASAQAELEVGDLARGIVGALIGSPKIEVYRFRPDTPQQVSVVIGVGPSITKNGGAR